LEIRIRRRARNLTRIKSEHSQLRINRGFVATCYRTRAWLISRVGGGRANLERDPFDYRQKMDGAGSNHWRFAGRLAQHPPMALFENFTQRISNGRIVLFAADFFFGRTVEPNEMIGCDTALLSVKFRELDRIGNGLVVENDRRL